MELVKPEPLVIGGRAHYTLTSYDPVSIDVDVPYTTEEDVEYALQVTVAQAGGGPAQLNDDAWMREQFEDVSGVDDRRWEKKGILVVYAKDGRRFTLDTWHHVGAKELAERILGRSVASW